MSDPTGPTPDPSLNLPAADSADASTQQTEQVASPVAPPETAPAPSPESLPVPEPPQAPSEAPAEASSPADAGATPPPAEAPAPPLEQGATSADVGAALHPSPEPEPPAVLPPGVQPSPDEPGVLVTSEGQPISLPAADEAGAPPVPVVIPQAPAGPTISSEDADFSNRDHRQVLRNVLHDGNEYAPGSVIDVSSWDADVVAQLEADGAISAAGAGAPEPEIVEADTGDDTGF